jgi:hypothetical protein
LTLDESGECDNVDEFVDDEVDDEFVEEVLAACSDEADSDLIKVE